MIRLNRTRIPLPLNLVTLALLNHLLTSSGHTLKYVLTRGVFDILLYK